MSRKYLTLIFFLLCVVLINAQPVTVIKDGKGGLPELFKRAFEKGGTNNNFWIGYAIERKDKRSVMTGSFNCNEGSKYVSLRDLILNTRKAQEYESEVHKRKTDRRDGGIFSINYGISINEEQNRDKETAILFLYNKSSKSINDIMENGICNLSGHFDLDGYPLLWLGLHDNKSSLNFLSGMYKQASELRTKRALAAAIGVHNGEKETTGFLKNIITGNGDAKLRADAAFWLGFQDNREALNVLNKTVGSDPSIEVRKNAVWGIGYMDLPEALDDLIIIAKHSDAIELRRDAIYALGNMAVKKAEEALKNFVDNDPDIEIKKCAVYALASGSGENITFLIKIAETNPSLEIRKCAIYSLSNSDDERALNALIKMAEQ